MVSKSTICALFLDRVCFFIVFTLILLTAVKIQIFNLEYALTNWILDSGATCHMTPEVTDFIPGSLEDMDKFIVSVELWFKQPIIVKRNIKKNGRLVQSNNCLITKIMEVIL